MSFSSLVSGNRRCQLGERQILPFNLLRGIFLQTQVIFLHTCYQYSPFLEDAHLWGLLCAALSSLIICSVHYSLLGLPRCSALFPRLSPQGNFWVTLHDPKTFQSNKLGQSSISLCFTFPFLVSHGLSFDNHCFIPFLPMAVLLLLLGRFFVDWLVT